MNTIELYQQAPSQELAQQLLDEHKDIIKSHVTKWSGVLPDVVIKKHAEKYALDAFKTYDPSKGAAINTHLYNHLSKLSRLNYENQNVVKVPEHQIRVIGNYQTAIEHLTDVLDRTPTHEEIADHMVLPVSHIKRLATNVGRKEYSYDSDNDLQQGDIEDDSSGLYLKDTFGKLSKVQKAQFSDLTGYQGNTSLSPAQFGKKYNLKPYEVSRVKAALAKRFGK